MFQGLFNIINIPLGYVMRFLAGIFNNDFAAAVAVFTLLINVVLIPLSIKSQKSSVQQMRIKPKMDELRKKYGDDRQKMAMAQQELYQQEGVSMSGGCLPMLIRLALMMSIYWLIMSPFTYMAGADAKNIDNIYNKITSAKEYNDEYKDALGWDKVTTNNKELAIIGNLREDGNIFEEVLSPELYAEIKPDVEKLIEIDNDNKTHINFYLFGNKDLDLTKTPKFSFNIFKEAQLLWLIPIGAFLAQLLTSLISMRVNKINNPEAPSMMGMMLTMPLISLFIGFGLPAGVGFYWICSSLIGGLIQSGVQLWYGPHKLLARERAKELGVQCDFETKQLNKFNNNEDSESVIKD
ncbi:MAG: YidC/Oxa1 family membrane protein insertase [Ruminococcaceae bacterium]|nr:YidC/Oxa1 family membrane protein insertase [Oscillospiraceae bacterium]